AVVQVEVNPAPEVMVHGVEVPLLPDVPEWRHPLASRAARGPHPPAFDQRLLGVGATEEVEAENSPGAERPPGHAEVAAERLATLEHPVREVECQGHVHPRAGDVPDIVVEERQAAGRLTERGQPVAPPPLERRAVEIDAPGLTPWAPRHPFAGGGGGA